MIKILYLTTDSRIGGTERTILDIVECLDRKCFLPFICSLIGQGPLLEQTRKIGINAYSLEMKSKIDLRAVFRLSHLLRKWDIDILHTHLAHANLLGFLASRIQPVKLFIYTDHFIYHKRKSFIKFCEEFIMRHYNDKIIAVANIVKEYLVKEVKIDKTKIVLIPNGIDLEKFKPQDAKFQNLYTIVTVANLSLIKGHIYLIKAMMRVIKQYPNTRLILVGEGSFRDKLIKIVYHLGLERYVDFLGFRQDIPEILSAADLFVLPSIWETAPLSLLEAMAMGMPIVATRVGGIPEIIKENESGLLVPAGESEALAQGIMTLLSDRPRAKKMGEIARLVVENRFDLKEVVKVLEKIYVVSFS